MVPPARLERTTRGLGNRCSIHLSYGGAHTNTRGPDGVRLRATNVPRESLSCDPMEGLPDTTAVLVLAGGEGRRMGGAKAWLAWRGRPLLLEVLERLEPLAPGAVWVVAAAGQDLPAGAYRRADDEDPGAGPLAGLAAGLAAVAAGGLAGRVAVSACDYPFADSRTFQALAVADPAAPLVLPRWNGHLHPLQALWHTRLAESCRAALARGERRVRPVVEAAGATVVDAESLPGGIDPERALLNLNDRESLARARHLANAAG